MYQIASSNMQNVKKVFFTLEATRFNILHYAASILYILSCLMFVADYVIMLLLSALG